MSSQPGDSIFDTDPLVAIDLSKIDPSWPLHVDTMDMSVGMISGGVDDVITISSNPNASPGYLYTTAITGAGTGADINGMSWTQPAPKLTLNGEDADIEINGVSLTKTLQSLQDRLNILRPNADLESRWDELRQVRERYQQLEQEILEKERAWKALQQRG